MPWDTPRDRALSRQGKSTLIFTMAVAAQPPLRAQGLLLAFGLAWGLLLQPGKQLHKPNKHNPVHAAGSTLQHDPTQRLK